MSARKGAGLADRADDPEAQGDAFGERAPDSLSRNSSQVIIATLTGSDECSALGITAGASSPVIELCKMLIEAGHDPRTSLHVFRGPLEALRVRSIGEAAGLRVSTKGTGFVRLPAVTTAPLVRQNELAATSLAGQEGHAP
jgi:hypothetical protein